MKNLKKLPSAGGSALRPRISLISLWISLCELNYNQPFAWHNEKKNGTK